MIDNPTLVAPEEKVLPPYTKQEIFDIVCEHLLTQNEQSLSKTTGACMYRTTDGNTPGKLLKCAIGPFIPDNLYNRESCEQRSFRNLYRAFTPRIANTPEMVDFVGDLQSIHDGASTTIVKAAAGTNGLRFYWIGRLEGFAALHSLDTFHMADWVYANMRGV